MTPDLLADAVFRRTAGDPAYLGWWLGYHRLANGWTWADLATHLGTDAHHLAKLALCAVPRPESFAADVTAAAAAANVSPAAVAALLRQVEAFRHWDDVQPSGAGWMLAAHDADPESPDDAPGP